VPTSTEYEGLIQYLGDCYSTGGILKEVGTIHWTTPNTGASDGVNFMALPAGWRDTGVFGAVGTYLYLWNSDDVSGMPTYKHVTDLIYNSAGIGSTNLIAPFCSGGPTVRMWPKTQGLSIRLLKDTSTSGADGTIVSNGYTGNDSQQYNTVVIDGYEWLAINLKETKYRDGSSIPEVQDITTWNSLSSGAMCYYV
jgi:hypothetical protein